MLTHSMTLSSHRLTHTCVILFFLTSNQLICPAISAFIPSHLNALPSGEPFLGVEKTASIRKLASDATRSRFRAFQQQEVNRNIQGLPSTSLNVWPFKNPSGGSSVKENDVSIEIGENIGIGSYGTVHLCTFSDGNKDEIMVAKRAWNEQDLAERATGKEEESNQKSFADRAKRCQHFLDVERHCFEKIQKNREDSYLPQSTQLPKMIGTFPDENGQKWLVFSLIERKMDGIDMKDLKATPARTLADAIKLDWKDQHSPSATHHHLYIVQRELGMPEDSTFGDTLDTVFKSLLSVVSEVHQANIVHRDVKPGNLLCDPSTSSFVLFDFGSAADMDPTNSFSSTLFASIGADTRKRVGLDDDIVAVSPIYSAPEVFVKWDKSPLNFDTFSCALVFCQLLFNLLDERIDASFRQQLEDARCDLDAWLEEELISTIRPVGLEDGINYLGERPGMWQLLKDMLQKDPERRATSQQSLKRLNSILSKVGQEADTDTEKEESFFDLVVSSYGTCDISDLFEELTMTPMTEGAMVIPRPLHYVATFKRDKPLGLVLSEANEDVNTDDDGDDDEKTILAWEKATKNASPGEVFVRSITPCQQADDMGIIEVGDRLRAVGEISAGNGGFEKVVGMLSRQPRSATTVTLHFDRKPAVFSNTVKKAKHLAKVTGQGVWSSKGRRQAQEDSFVLHEIHDKRENNVLLAGIFDGHGGNSASTSAAQLLPSLLAAELASIEGKATPNDLETFLVSSWNTICRTYREGCAESGACIADYDPREGIIMAQIGSQDIVAGTTAAVAMISVDDDGTDELTILNCGDSRVIVVGRPLSAQQEKSSVIHFSTRDHSPGCDLEMARLKAGQKAGLDYSLPECSLGSRWRLRVGDYQYAVSRSLEGRFATSKGIVSDADITKLNLANMLSERESGVIVIASDGLFEVLDNEQIGRKVLSMRESGSSAADVAKNVCSMALENGTRDNVSVVVVFFD